MEQLYLFAPGRIGRRRLQAALERLDAESAARELERFRIDSPGAELTWEEEACALLVANRRRGLTPDEGHAFWSGLRGSRLYGTIPASSAALIERRFFQLLLAFDRLNMMAAGRSSSVRRERRSTAELNLRAGFPRRARRLLEEHLKQQPDCAELLLLLGNSYWMTGRRHAALECFRDALLRGLSSNRHGDIAEERLADFLRGAGCAGSWAAAEAAVAGMVPVPVFSSAAELSEWTARFEWLSRPSRAVHPELDGANQFYVCLVVSVNRRWEPPELVPARMRMKQLHPRLHRRHMNRIETLPGPG